MFKVFKFVPASIPDSGASYIGENARFLGKKKSTSLVAVSVGMDEAELAQARLSDFPPPTRFLCQPSVFTPMHQWSITDSSLPGIINSGNTCYFNSILQSLFASPAFAHYLLSKKHSVSMRQVSFDPMVELENIAQRGLRSGRPSSIDASRLTVSGLPSLSKSLHKNTQEDAHQALLALLNSCREAELRQVGTSGLAERSLRTTATDQIFGGWIRTTRKCSTCDHSVQTFAPFLSLMLPPCRSVPQGLAEFSRPEQLQGDNSPLCPSCRKRTPATLSTRIEEAPRCCYIVLPRCGRGGALMKNRSDCTYDFTLDLSPALDLEQPVIYDLAAVVVHHGTSLDLGHYTAYTRTPQGTWRHCDDERVSAVSATAVLGHMKDAYLLLYVRRDPSPGAGLRSKLAVGVSTEQPQKTAPQTVREHRRHKHSKYGVVRSSVDAPLAGSARPLMSFGGESQPGDERVTERERRESIRRSLAERRQKHTEILSDKAVEELARMQTLDTESDADGQPESAPDEQTDTAGQAVATSSLVGKVLHNDRVDALLSGQGYDRDDQAYRELMTPERRRSKKRQWDKILDMGKRRRTREEHENRARTAAELYLEELNGERDNTSHMFQQAQTEAEQAKREGRKTDRALERERWGRVAAAKARREHFNTKFRDKRRKHRK